MNRGMHWGSPVTAGVFRDGAGIVLAIGQGLPQGGGLPELSTAFGEELPGGRGRNFSVRTRFRGPNIALSPEVLYL